MTNMASRDEVVVHLHGERFPILQDVFVEILGNSVASGRAPFRHALEKGEIQYSELLNLARVAEVPHPLFFAPLDVVKAQVKLKTNKLLQGVSADTFTVNTRTTIALRDVELVVKDLLRKQAFAKRHDSTLGPNTVVGLLRTPGASVPEDAKRLRAALGLDQDFLVRQRSKRSALESLISLLEAKQIFVSRSVRGYMPQLLDGIHFSGLTIRDKKVPYIFLAGGDHGDEEEPIGRQIFTLMLMTVLVARNIFAPVTYDARSSAPEPGREYDLVGELLMPLSHLRAAPLDGLDQLKQVADLLKVTPSALAVRAMRLNLVDSDSGQNYLQALSREFAARPASGPMNQPKPVNAVRKYSGRAFATRMLGAVDSRAITEKEFCRVVCLNRLSPRDLIELRAALR